MEVGEGNNGFSVFSHNFINLKINMKFLFCRGVTVRNNLSLHISLKECRVSEPMTLVMKYWNLTQYSTDLSNFFLVTSVRRLLTTNIFEFSFTCKKKKKFGKKGVFTRGLRFGGKSFRHIFQRVFFLETVLKLQYYYF